MDKKFGLIILRECVKRCEISRSRCLPMPVETEGKYVTFGFTLRLSRGPVLFICLNPRAPIKHFV